MISLSSTLSLLEAMRRAHSIVLTSYILRPGAVLDALESAAERGAHVTVRLEGRPYGDNDGKLAAGNQHTVEVLSGLGADAALMDTSDADGPLLHMKAAVCDGVAFLDDRNWPGYGTDTILRDDFHNDAAAIEAAALKRPAPPTRWFWTTKTQSLAGEARLLYGASHAKTVDVESESFGAPGGAYAPLKELAQRGVHCRLIVAERDLQPKSMNLLNILMKAGVEVRVADFDEKMAIVDSQRAWTGSTNTTDAYYHGDQVDWGVRTDAPDVVNALQSRFDAQWNAAKPLLQGDAEKLKRALALAAVTVATSS